MHVQPHILKYAQAQRITRNPWEAKLWRHLRAGRMLGFKFKRQVPIGNFIADFCCHEKRLIVEADGQQHATSTQADQDAKKDAYLRGEKYIVLRFYNTDIDKNLQGVLETIRQHLQQ
jgi:very-short-patch-repair endonuclease